MPTPNFFIMGAPKCGTTSMYGYLSTHPAVFMPRIKEPHYFATDLPARRRMNRQADYLAIFASANERHSAVGEASTWYLFSKEAAPRIRRFCPDARLVVFFRNPVEFVQSLHDQFAFDERRSPDFPAAWRARRAEFLEYGSFGVQLERLLDVFPREQILTILLDDLVEDPAMEYRRVLNHLGLEDDGRDDFPAYNRRKLHRSEWLADFLMNTPRPVTHLWLRFKRVAGLGRLGLFKRLARFNTRSASRPTLDPGLRKEVHEAFAQDVQRLSGLLGKDLSHWV